MGLEKRCLLAEMLARLGLGPRLQAGAEPGIP